MDLYRILTKADIKIIKGNMLYFIYWIIDICDWCLVGASGVLFDKLCPVFCIIGSQSIGYC